MKLYAKRITLKLIFKLSYPTSNFALTLDYLNRASNNPAQAINSEQSFDPSSKKYPESCPMLYDEFSIKALALLFSILPLVLCMLFGGLLHSIPRSPQTLHRRCISALLEKGAWPIPLYLDG